MMAINIAEGPAEKKTISAASGQQSSRSLKSSEKTCNQRRQGTRHRITSPFLDHVQNGKKSQSTNDFFHGNIMESKFRHDFPMNLTINKGFILI